MAYSYGQEVRRLRLSQQEFIFRESFVNLIDHKLLKKYLKMLNLPILALRTFFKAFYEEYIPYPKLNIYSQKHLFVA